MMNEHTVQYSINSNKKKSIKLEIDSEKKKKPTKQISKGNL